MFSAYETQCVPGAQAGKVKSKQDSLPINFHLEFWFLSCWQRFDFSLLECKRIVRGYFSARKNDSIKCIYGHCQFLCLGTESRQAGERCWECLANLHNTSHKILNKPFWHWRIPSCWGLWNFTFLEKKQDKTKLCSFSIRLAFPQRSQAAAVQTLASGRPSAAGGSHHMVWLHEPTVSTDSAHRRGHHQPFLPSALTLCTCSQCFKDSAKMNRRGLFQGTVKREEVSSPL